VPKTVREGSARLTLGESNIIISGEIVDSLWEEDFTTLEDKHIVEDLRERLKVLGLDPSEAETIVKKSRTSGVVRRSPVEPVPIQPHREWDETKKRLDEQAKRTANILLNNVGLKQAGAEIPYKYTTLNIPARNNYIAALMMVNNEIHKKLGKDRKDCSTSELKSAIESLEEILKLLVRKLKKAQDNHEKQQT
jgi:hypothetical protein